MRFIHYKKLYAYLVGQVDDALAELDVIMANRSFDRVHTVRVYEKLQNALRSCEEQYITAEDETQKTTPYIRRL